MSKDVPWFKHDENASDDPKIHALQQLHGMAGYGRWWTIVEYLRGQDGYVMALTKWTFRAFADKWKCKSEEAEQFIRELIGEEIELLKAAGETAWSERLLNDMDLMAESKKRYAAAGRKGGKASAKHRSSDAQATPGHRSSNENYENYKKRGGKRKSAIPAGAAAPVSPPSSAPPFQEGILKNLSEIHQAETGKPIPELSEKVRERLTTLEHDEFPEDIQASYCEFQKAHPGRAMNLFLDSYVEYLRKAKKSPAGKTPPIPHPPREPCPKCKAPMVPHRGKGAESWDCFECRLIFVRGQNGNLVAEVPQELPAAPALGPPLAAAAQEKVG